MPISWNAQQSTDFIQKTTEDANSAENILLKQQFVIYLLSVSSYQCSGPFANIF